MKRKPLQPITMAQVFADLANMPDDVFDRFLSEAASEDAFDSDKERVEPLALRLGLDVETVRITMSFLSFIYDEINDDSTEKAPLEDSIKQIIDSARRSDYAEAYLSDINDDILSQRLSLLLIKNSNIEIYNKSKRLRRGFMPFANDFSSFVDLRPLLADDKQAVLKLIPIVQFKINSESSQSQGKSYVFQMDRRRLKALKDAVDAALQQLDTVARTESFSRLVS